MIFILGPTASGKSSLGLELARQIPNAHIISADSRQSYRNMDIGTAKPTPNELQQIPHLNINILNPSQKDSASKFLSRVQEWESIHPSYPFIVVGGSTLYLRALLFKPNDIPESDPNTLKKLTSELEAVGIEDLYHRLKTVDPLYAEKMDGFNTQRILRALCVFEMTGKPFSSFHSRTSFIKPDHPNALVFGITMGREHLYKRINERVDLMFEQGLVSEVEHLLTKGVSFQDPGMQTVGYKEFKSYFNRKVSLEEVKSSIKTSSRRYAKRQLTWFKKWSFIHWLNAESKSTEEMAQEILTHKESLP